MSRPQSPSRQHPQNPPGSQRLQHHLKPIPDRPHKLLTGTNLPLRHPPNASLPRWPRRPPHPHTQHNHPDHRHNPKPNAHSPPSPQSVPALEPLAHLSPASPHPWSDKTRRSPSPPRYRSTRPRYCTQTRPTSDSTPAATRERPASPPPPACCARTPHHQTQPVSPPPPSEPCAVPASVHSGASRPTLSPSSHRGHSSQTPHAPKHSSPASGNCP